MQIGLGGGQIGQSLPQLLIDFRSLNFGQELPGLDVGANIRIPVLEIAVGARVDRRIDVCLDICRQHDFLRRRGVLRMNHRDGGDCHFRGFSGERGAGLDARKNA